MKLQQGDTAGALAAYEQGLAISEKLAAADPRDGQGQRDLAYSYGKLGDVKLLQGDTAGALAACEQGLAIREKLAAADPRDAQGQRDLSISYDDLGDVKLQEGDTAGAWAAYEQEPGDPRKAGRSRSARRPRAARSVAFVWQARQREAAARGHGRGLGGLRAGPGDQRKAGRG